MGNEFGRVMPRPGRSQSRLNYARNIRMVMLDRSAAWPSEEFTFLAAKSRGTWTLCQRHSPMAASV